jgi:hypothetical protein
MCTISTSRQFSNYWYSFVITNFRSSKTRLLTGEVETKIPPPSQKTCTSDASAPQEVAPTLPPVPHRQLVGFEINSSRLHRM